VPDGIGGFASVDSYGFEALDIKRFLLRVKAKSAKSNHMFVCIDDSSVFAIRSGFFNP